MGRGAGGRPEPGRQIRGAGLGGQASGRGGLAERPARRRRSLSAPPRSFRAHRTPLRPRTRRQEPQGPRAAAQEDPGRASPGRPGRTPSAPAGLGPGSRGALYGLVHTAQLLSERPGDCPAADPVRTAGLQRPGPACVHQISVTSAVLVPGRPCPICAPLIRRRVVLSICRRRPLGPPEVGGCVSRCRFPAGSSPQD